MKTFLTTPNTYGWDVKRKLVWFGQHSYLFRLPCAAYIHDHGGKADIPTLDDFLCQETTQWSGLGVIDILAATLDLTDEQRRDLRSWYERHMAYFRVVSLREPFMDVINLLNEQPYTIHVGEIGDTFRVDDVVFGSLVLWDGVWYWSGVQQKYEHVTDEVMQQIKRIADIFGTQTVPKVTEETLALYLDYLKQHLEVPCQLTGIESRGCFAWEASYIFGRRRPKEYAQRKQHQPSYTDTYTFLRFEEKYDPYDGLAVKVKRGSDSKRFVLPLANLKATEKPSHNAQLLDDYVVWFVNGRR